ncbi:MAG: alpha/beta hydrolase [Nanoarchaeota archaeon]|nr:alpha/beta hydrolase [Nanoarchaeota archaeon]MCB0370612.1 alpha/beta hydrolase [Bdellovibrionales bacterium]
MSTKDTVRIYGNSPIKAFVIHGGPGAPGYMAPVARELSKAFGVVEPLQTKNTLKGQIQELHDQITEYSERPVCMIGSSWGATLALLYASEHPEMLAKVVLIGSCVYDAESSEKVKEIRSERMSVSTKKRLQDLTGKIELNQDTKNKYFSEAADCFFESDTYDPISTDLEVIECQYEINKSVWSDFKVIRDSSNDLKRIFSKIKIPVVNIHGDYDPHIIDGIQPFLEESIDNIKLYTLKKCGHYPWIERSAKDDFYKILLNEIEEENMGKKID